MFSGNTATAISNAYCLMEILGVAGGGAGLFGLIKWLKNRQIKNIVKLDTGDAQIEAEGGEVRVASMKEVKLLGILSIRKNVEAFVKPLEKEGVDKVAFISKDGRQEITKQEIEYFKAPIIEEEIIGETVTQKSLQIMNAAFQEGGKWKFFDGTSAFFADIQDPEFIRKIQHNEVAFAKDDILHVELKTVQSLVNGQIRADHIIVKILGHRSAAVQIRFPFSDKE
ncbi:MAG: hypothetical protein ABIB04_01700 [Patescibacteria group bacterium]